MEQGLYRMAMSFSAQIPEKQGLAHLLEVGAVEPAIAHRLRPGGGRCPALSKQTVSGCICSLARCASGADNPDTSCAATVRFPHRCRPASGPGVAVLESLTARIIWVAIALSKTFPPHSSRAFWPHRSQNSSPRTEIVLGSNKGNASKALMPEGGDFRSHGSEGGAGVTSSMDQPSRFGRRAAA